MKTLFYLTIIAVLFSLYPGSVARAEDPLFGELLYAGNCQQCHGKGALGTDNGPPFIHKIYEPNHHGDTSFYMAVSRGVRAHHWRFGDMPPIKALKRDEVEEIIKYVRRLQREAGIF